jgi:hypothetical protein
MTAVTRLETWTNNTDQSLGWVKHSWHFILGNTFVNIDEGLTDEDMVMSVASKETWQGGTCLLELHKIGWAIFNPGPSFAVGDVILYDQYHPQL